MEKAGVHSFSCTMLLAPEHLTSELQHLQDQIDDADLAGDGKEDEFHVTACYGTHTSDVEKIKDVLREVGLDEISLRFSGLSTFPPSEHSEGATVLKLDVESEDLERINAAIRKALPTTDSFPDYHPHLTLAYVKTAAAEKYLGKRISDDGGDAFTSSSIVFSQQDGEQVHFDLHELFD